MSNVERPSTGQAAPPPFVKGFGDEAETPLPDHLIRLPGGSWRLWRAVGLRGAGFPAAAVLALGSPSAAAAADELIEADEGVEQAHRRLLAAVNLGLDNLHGQNDAESGSARAELIKTLRQVKKGKEPRPTPAVGGTVLAGIDEWNGANARYQAALKLFRQKFDEAQKEVSQAIRSAVRQNSFREAVIWQNRRAYHTGINALLRSPEEGGLRGSKLRQHEELVASYLQRYCVKNDTIGFFGPVGWARLESDGEAVRVRPGENFLAIRNIYFEVWCIDALARKLAKNKMFLPWLAPRRMPFVYVEGTKLHVALRNALNVTTAQATALNLCDGQKPAREIVAELRALPACGIGSEKEAYQLLDLLRRWGLISWTLEVPMDLHPEYTLRRTLEGIGNERLRAAALDALTELEQARDAVAPAASDPEKLDQALSSLEETFTRLTGVEPTRSAGKTYAARTLVFEDCRRDTETTFGPEFLSLLGPPLGLMLTGSRWFTYQTAEIYRRAFDGIYDDLSRETGSPTLSFMSFWTRAEPLFANNGKALLGPLIEEAQERWAQVLNLPYEERRVSFTAEELLPRVEAAFAAPRCGWKFARYHSPDVMLAAPSAEAIRQGDYQLVLGELHTGVNTLGWPLFLAQNPAPEELFRGLELDLPDPRLVSMIAKTHRLLTSARLAPALVSAHDCRLELAPQPSDAERSKVVQVGELVVDREGDQLVVRTRDRRVCFDVMEALADALTGMVMSQFKIFRPVAHTPRVSIGQLVICRESWSFSPSEIAFAFEKDEAARFVAARRWARAHGIPRFVFIKSSVEMKPSYVDFESPTYVNIFAKTIRHAVADEESEPRIGVSEMLPTHHQCWLRDAEGQRFTSELRIVALDSAT